ncbi:MAG: hypothetical protein AVO39_07090 [delta proteobacterium MLS_D]|jgi:hypothetical protein|nr:MAG: hypothetical protein AVO39_07090 [delta proteobacterium MLS_D]
MKKCMVTLSIFILMAAVFGCSLPRLPDGHVHMRQGKMISLSDGSEMTIEVQGTRGAIYPEGVMLAVHPTSGETFRGKYYLVSESSTSTGVVQNKWGTKTGKITTTSENKYLKGVLKGNQGSVLHVDIAVGKQNSNFYGEATDAKGGKYQIILSPQYISRKVQ